MFERQVFRPISNLALASTVFLLAILFPVEPLLRGDWLGFAATATISATASSLAWLLFVRPKLVVDGKELTIVNPFRTITVPYGRIELVEAQYSLVVTTDAGKFSCWVAPAPSRYGGRGVIKADIRNLPITSTPDSLIKASDSPKAHSGQAGILVRMALDAFTKSGISSDDRVEVKINIVGASLALVSLISAAVVQLLH